MSLGEEPELNLVIPAKPAYVRTARHAVSALARLHGAPEDVVEDLRLAVSEACNSALPDRLEGAPNLRVLGFANEERIVVEVFDPSATVERAVSGPPGELATGDLPFERSLSLPVIRGLVDDLSIRPDPSGGMAMRMTLDLQGRDGGGPSSPDPVA